VPEVTAWDAVRPLRQWARENPEHARWIAEGAPRLTDLEYLERFGAPYQKPPTVAAGTKRKGRT